MDLCLRTESQPFKAVCLRGKKSFIYKSFPFQRNTLKFLVHNDSFPHKLLSGEQNTLFHTFMRWGPSYPLQPRLAPHRACRHCRQPQFYLLLSLLLAHLDRSPGREAHSRLSSPGYHYHIQPSSSLLLHWGGKKNASCRFLAGRSQRLSCVTHLAAKPARLTCGAAPLPALWGGKQRKARSLPNTSCVAPRAALSARANSRRCSDRGHRGRLDAGSSAAAAVEARGRSTQPAASARADQITLVPYPRALAQLSPLQPIRIPNSPQLQTLKFSQRALLFLARANVSNADVRSPRLSSQLRIPLIPCKEAERKAVTYRL